MNELKNPMEIFKLLKKTNCRESDAPTCLAFSVAVFQGQKQIDECPYLEDEIIEKYKTAELKQNPGDINFEENLKKLKEKIKKLDISLLADKLGGNIQMTS